MGVDSSKLEYWLMVVCLLFLALGLGDGHILTFWLLL